MELDQDEHEGEHGEAEPGDSPAEASGADPRSPAAGSAAAPGKIDMAKLAAKVYKLMREEIRLERARGAGARGR